MPASTSRMSMRWSTPRRSSTRTDSDPSTAPEPTRANSSRNFFSVLGGYDDPHGRERYRPKPQDLSGSALCRHSERVNTRIVLPNHRQQASCVRSRQSACRRCGPWWHHCIAGNSDPTQDPAPRLVRDHGTDSRGGRRLERSSSERSASTSLSTSARRCNASDPVSSLLVKFQICLGIRRFVGAGHQYASSGLMDYRKASRVLNLVPGNSVLTASEISVATNRTKYSLL